MLQLKILLFIIRFIHIFHHQNSDRNQIFINQLDNKMDQNRGAKRLTGFDKPTVWSVMTPLAVKTKSINLGQGFPAWSPPDFYLKFLEESLKESHHQYTRAFGSLNLVQAIAKFHSKRFGELNPETNIVTTNGGVQGLFCSIVGLVNEGEQVVFFDPSYDCYRSQIQIAGGKSIGLPLHPKIQQTKAMIKQRCKQGYKSSQNDQWQIDFQAFEKSLNERTKLFIFNTPHNPVGKVFSEAEISKLSQILKKYPNIIVVEDNVYEGMTFDDYFEKDLPKFAHIPEFKDRTLSIYSAGKIFAATGVRSGWVIGSEDLIRCVRSVHQYNVFCYYNLLENTVAKSLDQISKPDNTYMKQYAQKLTDNRNLLLDELIDSGYDFDLWIPQGGYFIIADIQRIPVSQKYQFDEDGNKRSKDYALCIELAYQKGVVAIPCSPFYSKQDVNLGERYIRFAFCKQKDMIKEAGKRLK